MKNKEIEELNEGVERARQRGQGDILSMMPLMTCTLEGIIAASGAHIEQHVSTYCELELLGFGYDLNREEIHATFVVRSGLEPVILSLSLDTARSLIGGYLDWLLGAIKSKPVVEEHNYGEHASWS